MSGRPRYTARYERDVDGRAWLVAIDGIEGCHSHGRTLAQAAARIEEALALWLEFEPAGFELEHAWPDAVARTADRVTTARAAAEEAARQAGLVLAGAVAELDALGLSRRDSAAVLGVSHQRVQQVLAADRSVGSAGATR